MTLPSPFIAFVLIAAVLIYFHFHRLNAIIRQQAKQIELLKEIKERLTPGS